MEKEINVAEILKDKPKGTKLYDLLYNVDVELDKISTTDTETVVWCTNETDNNTTCHRGYSEFGTVRGCPDGLQILLPSKEMRDWRKFDWKKGDVLISNDSDILIIFNGFSKDDYTIFEGKHWISLSKKRHISCLNMQNTQNYHIEDNKEVVQTYIKTIEERLGGKLNRETLEIEKAQPEFKDGDIVAVDLDRKNIRIFKEKKNENNICFGKYYIGFSFNNGGKQIQTFKNYTADCSSDRLATEEEKQQLFDALAKEGKVWDSKKKQIVNLKPKWMTLKPFDKVITRVDVNAIWTANIFSHVDQYGEYVTIGCVGGYPYCLPYNEETAKLIGTTNNWEG